MAVRGVRLLTTFIFTFLVLGALSGWGTPVRAEEEAVTAAPDLVIELEIEPTNPNPGDPIDIYVTVRNVGDASTGGGVTLDIYYGRTSVPPASEQGNTPTSFPAIGAGQFQNFSVIGAATANGTCGYGVFVRVDRGNTIAESNENNNLANLCEAPPCSADGFEVDNACTSAKWFSEGTAQKRNLCDTGGPDQDWVKFTAYAGLTYTVATSTTTSSADPRVTIYGSCSGAPLKGPSNDNASLLAPHSGVFYAKIERATTAPIVNANYDLALQVTSGVPDEYEPNDPCSNARDIATNGVKQNHRFSKPNDEDWVKFTAPAGSAFSVVADGGQGGANPVITIATSCANATSNQPPAEVNVAEATASESAEAAATITGEAATTTIYYVQARNQNGSVWGANVRYDLRVAVTACSGDAAEPDNAATQAKTLTLGVISAGRTACPPGDQDWVQFALTAGKTYVVETRNLATGADTVLSLYAPDQVTLLGENDDYGYTKGSRLVFVAASSGTHYARVRHANASASGATTAYGIVLLEGVCVPLGGDAQGGDNGSGDATPLTLNGAPLAQNFCADPLNASLGDQDWSSFATVPGGKYQVRTTGLGSNSDTVIQLYNASGQLLKSSDDVGPGRATTLDYDATTAGTVYVRVLQFNSNVLGGQTEYQVSVAATQPAAPTPTPTPTPIPPPPTPTPNPSTAKTLIVVNRARIETLYGAPKATSLMSKLFQLADAVDGAVLEVEKVPAIAAAYAAWTADANSLADNGKANAVAAAIRAQLMTFIQGSNSQAKYVVLVGDDRVIPFRRTLDLVVPPGNSTSTEDRYATDVSAGSTVRAALAQKMILTDDYYVDKQPGTWKDKQRNQHELFLPDLAISRLVEDPNEMIAYIDQFLGNGTIAAQRILLTGYDFVQDGADAMGTLFSADPVPGSVINDTLIGPAWPAANLRTLHLTQSPAFNITALSGHSTHVAILVPKIQGNSDITAAEVDGASNLAGTLVYSMGCHGGLNDPGVLDLPQAYMRRKATYVGNTGYGWGGGGVVYTEAMMRSFTREILRDARAEVGPALVAAKLKYYGRVQAFNAFDAKVLMQVTLYGLPMYAITSGGSLTNENDFPSAEPTITPPTSFGAPLATGGFSYGLANSFGSFGESAPAGQGTQFDLDGNVVFEAGAPVQPTYAGSAAAPAAGTLRGVLFLGGTFSDTVGIDPVIALAENEYVLDRSEPAYVAEDGWSPAVPFVVRNSDDISPPAGVAVDSVALSLGQFNADAPAGTVVAAGGSGVQRLYDTMSLATYYSFSADQVAPTLTVVDGVLDVGAGKGFVKVEASDPSGVQRVVVSYTTPGNAWASKDATWNAASQKWLAEVPARIGDFYFVQVVDGAGNIAVDNNKGNNYPLLPPLPLAGGASAGGTLYLPRINR